MVSWLNELYASIWIVELFKSWVSLFPVAERLTTVDHDQLVPVAQVQRLQDLPLHETTDESSHPVELIKVDQLLSLRRYDSLAGIGGNHPVKEIAEEETERLSAGERGRLNRQPGPVAQVESSDQIDDPLHQLA